MSVTVYSRLGELLRRSDMTVADLAQEIAVRFGLNVEVRTLDRLAHTARVRRPDLDVAAAAAAVLEVGLDDLFAVDVVPVSEEGARTTAVEEDILDPAQSRRLEALFDLREERSLTKDEDEQLRSLVAEYGRRSHERGLREIAKQRQLPLEQVRADVAADFEQKLAWWKDVQSDPARLQALVNEARERQKARATG